MSPQYLIPIILIAVLFSACGEDVGSNRFDRPAIIEEQEEVFPAFFRSRLNNSLLVAGDRCIGGETIPNAGGPAFICSRNQYLITIDNINTCDTHGCTETLVTPVIGELREAEVSNQVIIFDIFPISPTTSEQQEILNSIQVRTGVGAEVIFRTTM